jgi:ATP-dependent RNA helicase RhlE
MVNTPPTSAADFASLGIAPQFLQILQKHKFTQPTPIQAQAIPVALNGDDVIGIAQTGTGKTLAFGIPMLQRMVTHKGKGLVVVPTRELALQVEESLYKIGSSLGLKTAVLIGGEPMPKQLRALQKNPHIIIATPGRLIDHLQQKTLKLDTVKTLVLDEADRMLDMGFAPQIKQVMQHVPANRQTMLFSATMPQEIVAIANSYMKSPTRVEVAPAGTTAKNISQELIFVHPKEKMNVLAELLGENPGTVLVFTRTKFGAKKITRSLNSLNITAGEIHSNRSLSQRKDALEGFKTGRYRVLVATDIAARGIDVSGISLVVNYDLPEHAEDYVHRIGRTARAGKIGKAISLATPDQKFDVRAIERLIKMILPVTTKKGVQIQLPPDIDQRAPRPERSRFGQQRRPQGQSHGRSYEGRSQERPSQSSSRSQRPASSKPRSSSSRKPRPSNDRASRIYWYSAKV